MTDRLRNTIVIVIPFLLDTIGSYYSSQLRLSVLYAIHLELKLVVRNFNFFIFSFSSLPFLGLLQIHILSFFSNFATSTIAV